MAFAFPAYHTESISADVSHAEMLATVKNALGALSWSINEETTERIIASSSINLLSWGEKIIINILPDKKISVTSKCIFPLQCLDWGKNKANVRKFISELRKHVQQTIAPNDNSTMFQEAR